MVSRSRQGNTLGEHLMLRQQDRDGLHHAGPLQLSANLIHSSTYVNCQSVSGALQLNFKNFSAALPQTPVLEEALVPLTDPTP